MTHASLAKYIVKSPTLTKIFTPLASWYTGATGHRKLGLRFDDLLEEESDTVQLALKRLSAKDSYDRVFRIRRAVQCSYQHKLLPKEEWTKPEEDVPYLSPLVAEIEAELKEKDSLDAMEIIKKH